MSDETVYRAEASDRLSPEEEEWLKLSPQLVVQSVDQIRGAGRHVMGSAVALSGLYFTAIKLGAQNSAVLWSGIRIAPLVLWGLAYLVGLFAANPNKSTVRTSARGEIRNALEKLIHDGYFFLVTAQVLLFLGLLWLLFPAVWQAS